MEPNSLLRPDRLVKELPEIDAGERNLEVVSEQAWHAMERANDPERWFGFGGAPARLILDDGNAQIQLLDLDRMRHVLARVARWVQRIKDRRTQEVIEIEVAPPKDTVRDLLAYPIPPLPKLDRIVRAPVFAADGSIRTEAGYHAPSKTFYSPTSGFSIGPISDAPGRQHAEAAAKFILDELLPDFPFASRADRSHALLLLIQPFVRDLIVGPTPLYLIEKPKPGTGAGLLAEVLTHPSLGMPPPIMTEGRDEDDWRKRITAKLIAAPNVVLLDNLRRRLDSAALSAVLTATFWEDRILGRTKNTVIPVRCTWLATGNNPSLSSEMSRRIVRVRMDAKTDQPWLRTGFRHELPGWAFEHRADIVRSVVEIVAAWIAAGRLAATAVKAFGAYDDWTRVMGGILGFVEVPGFLENRGEVYEITDSEGGAWRRFFGEWWAQFGDRNVCVSDVFPIASSGDIFELGDGNEKSQRTRLGLLLRKQRDSQNGSFRLEAAPPMKGAQGWRLVNVENHPPHVHANVHQAEALQDQEIGGHAGPLGERCEPSSNAIAHAHARAAPRETLENVHNVLNVHREAPPTLFPEPVPEGGDVEEFDL